MTTHFNLPPGVLPTDLPGNDPNECPTCGGSGYVDGKHINTFIMCPTCSGLGVHNKRSAAKEDYFEDR